MTLPEEGGSKPAKMCISVVLPLPLSPISAVEDLTPKLKVNLSKIRKISPELSKDLLRFFTFTKGSIGQLFCAETYISSK